MAGVDDDQFKVQFAPVARLFQRMVTLGGLTTHEAYFLCVRRFPEAMRVG